MTAKARFLVIATAVGTLAGCGASGSHTAERPAGKAIPAVAQPTRSFSSAALSALLLNADSVPSGFTAKAASQTPADQGAQRPPADAPCSQALIPLLSATQLTGTASARASSTLTNDTDPDHFWVGTEVLWSYTGDAAEQAMAEVRTLVGRCPVVTTSDAGGKDVFRFAVASAPKLGDDSVHISCSMTGDSDPLECDSLLVRIGTTVLAVNEQGNDPGGDRYLPQLAEAGLREYQGQ